MRHAISPHETAAIRPPRATRRPIVSRVNLIASALAVIGFEAVLVVFLPRILDAYAWTLSRFEIGPVTREASVRGEVPVVGFEAPLPSPNVLVAIMGAAALVAFAAAYLTRGGPLLKGVVIAEATLFGAAAAFMLATGEPPFGASEFGSLYAETSVLTWLVLPLLLGLISLTVPFRVWERAVLVALIVAHGMLLSALRFGFFAETLDAGSAVLMAPLFLNFGPLLDFMGAVAIYSALLVRVSARLARGEPRRVWSWS